MGTPTIDELLERNEGQPVTWPLDEKLRLLAAFFDANDDLRQIVKNDDVQTDLRDAANLLDDTTAYEKGWTAGYDAGYSDGEAGY